MITRIEDEEQRWTEKERHFFEELTTNDELTSEISKR